MLDPKEVMMHLEDEAMMEFEDLHGREPNRAEAQRISNSAYDGIGDYYDDIRKGIEK